MIVREFRHIRSLKRGGRGHDPTGAEGTRQGKLSIPCQGCPHPNINVPQDDIDEYVGQYGHSSSNADRLAQLAQRQIHCHGC
jgi:hypothetical protein